MHDYTLVTPESTALCAFSRNNYFLEAGSVPFRFVIEIMEVILFSKAKNIMYGRFEERPAQRFQGFGSQLYKVYSKTTNDKDLRSLLRCNLLCPHWLASLPCMNLAQKVRLIKQKEATNNFYTVSLSQRRDYSIKLGALCLSSRWSFFARVLKMEKTIFLAIYLVLARVP